ncbi:hypothetical protein LJR225_003347 [Phenylobacterium sp. LjRoot225]|uniref:hypothetical protein n=1 Tax=Phenylobacterium sp. LjRoot225 TaxID=3342285 RepID=UPI003ECC88B8
MPSKLSPAVQATSRTIATVVVGYAATVGTVALLSLLLVLLLGMVRSEAIVLMSMIGFLGYVGIVVWGFAEPRLVRVWTVLGGVAVVGNGMAIALTPLLPPISVGGG